MPRATWPSIASWSPTLEQRYCVLLTRGRWLSAEYPAASGTGPLQLLPQEFGTVCLQTYEKPTCHTSGSGGRWKHFDSNSPTTAHCELFLTVPCRNILTYLLSNFTHSGLRPLLHLAKTNQLHSLQFLPSTPPLTDKNLQTFRPLSVLFLTLDADQPFHYLRRHSLS